jgi:HK97 gp10 family phage protein
MVQLEVKGLDGLIKKFDQLAKETQVGVNAALEDWANRTAQDAKQLVSANSSDEGALLRSISPSYGNGYAKVVASAKYAAYIEFGTRKFAASYVSTLPSDWAQYAATFKGSAGGTFKEMLLSIMAWCKRKGIDDKAAYPIARSILIKGIKQKPFLYPSVNKNLPLLIKDIKAIFK